MSEQPDSSRLSLVDLAAVVEIGDDPAGGSGDEISMIRRAGELVERSQEQLNAWVSTARQRDVSWRAIGDALGVSRQAAFKRFGGEAPGVLSGQPIDLLARTTEIFERLDAGDYDAVRTHMTYTCARALSKRKLLSVWDQVQNDTGRLESCVDATVQTPDGTNVVSKLANRHLSSGAIVQVVLRHELGEWIGRVAYNGSGKITGILIAPPDARDLPF